MPIVGGLDIHRKQLTFDYLDTVTGEVKRGQIAPADRVHLRAWLARFAGRDDVAFAMEGCTGWRYVAEELAAAGIAAHMGEPADTAAARGRKRHAKTDKTDSRHLRVLLAEGRLPECWVPPAQILECRALLEAYHDLRREHTAWVQRIHAVFFHQGAPALGEGVLRTEQGLAGLRAAAAAYLSPAGQLQVATALDMLAATEARMEVLRTQLRDAARHLTGAKVLAARLYGVGPITALAPSPSAPWPGTPGSPPCSSTATPGPASCSAAPVTQPPAMPPPGQQQPSGKPEPPGGNERSTPRTALSRAHTEILTQRRRIGELAGTIRDLETPLAAGSAQRITAENTTLHHRIRQLTGEHRTLRERLDAARSASRFLDRRVADLEAQIAEHIIQAT